MKRLLSLALLAVASACTLQAQAVDVKVCDVVKKPAAFNGKIVRLKGIVFAGFDSFVIKDTEGECGFPIDSIWLEYPQGTKGKAGAAAVLHIQPAHNYSGPYQEPARTPVTLDKSKDFKQFDSLLAQTHNKGAFCLTCARYQVQATLVGRLDTVADTAIKHDAAGKVTDFGGFGNMNMYPARLVLQSVSDVTPKEIDYAAADAAAKSDTSAVNSDIFDPMDASMKIATGPLGNTPMAEAAKKAAGAFGKKGEHNGVSIVFGNTSEMKDETPGKTDSPDGLLYTCNMISDRLQGQALVRAIFHMGQHIADLRTPAPAGAGPDALPPFILEYNAWTMSISSGVVSGQKFMALSGGNLVWSIAWTADERQGKMDGGVTGYLNKFAAINR